VTSALSSAWLVPSAVWLWVPESVDVHLIESADYADPVPVIAGSGRRWEACEASYAKVQLLSCTGDRQLPALILDALGAVELL
jgi:hypothetical protein